MRKALLVGFVLVGVASVAGTVMSQGDPLLGKRRDSFPNREEPNNAEIARMMIQIRSELSKHIAATDEPSARDLELMKALDTYLAADKLTAIIKQLEEIKETLPGSNEARKAAAAIQVLKSKKLEPDPRTSTFSPDAIIFDDPPAVLNNRNAPIIEEFEHEEK